MLHDRAKIFVQGGAGGDGVVSFRREAHVPRGGPDGGDGGRGADVVLVCDPSMRDLQAFRHRAHFKGTRGGHGEGSNRHGASPAALEVVVPPGTAVHDAERGTSWELTDPGARVVVARGGLGGRGNRHFTTPTRQAPRFAERGLAGEEGWLELQLRLLADAGLVGLPNAGKSSLLARITRAAPKVANYPFTTLAPVLGTLEGGDRQLVVADIPGLIEGASAGAGLGHEFLAHVEKTRLLVHVLDIAPVDGSDPVESHATVEAELAAHGAGLERLPRILCLSKADLVPEERAAEAAAEWRERLGGRALEVLVTSAATGRGLDDLKRAILEHVPEEAPVAAPAAEPGLEGLAEHRTYRPGGDGYSVERTGDGAFRIAGPRVERLLARHDPANEEAMRYVEDRLRGMGVIGALEAAGFAPGDDVEIGGIVFELDPGAPFG
ncbi:MAG: GTPase [Thermoleophilaceae bacterium]|nr:GTPase [Thermoleophilaceae bacterium]